MKRMAARLQTRLPNLTIWSYHVHGRRKAFLRHAAAMEESPGEVAVKVTALRCHKSQLALSERRFLHYATRGEPLVDLLASLGLSESNWQKNSRHRNHSDHAASGRAAGTSDLCYASSG